MCLVRSRIQTAKKRENENRRKRYVGVKKVDRERERVVV